MRRCWPVEECFTRQNVSLFQRQSVVFLYANVNCQISLVFSQSVAALCCEPMGSLPSSCSVNSVLYWWPCLALVHMFDFSDEILLTNVLVNLYWDTKYSGSDSVACFDDVITDSNVRLLGGVHHLFTRTSDCRPFCCRWVV